MDICSGSVPVCRLRGWGWNECVSRPSCSAWAAQVLLSLVESCSSLPAQGLMHGGFWEESVWQLKKNSQLWNLIASFQPVTKQSLVPLGMWRVGGWFINTALVLG